MVIHTYASQYLKIVMFCECCWFKGLIWWWIRMYLVFLLHLGNSWFSSGRQRWGTWRGPWVSSGSSLWSQRSGLLDFGRGRRQEACSRAPGSKLGQRQGKACSTVPKQFVQNVNSQHKETNACFLLNTLVALGVSKSQFPTCVVSRFAGFVYDIKDITSRFPSEREGRG